MSVAVFDQGYALVVGVGADLPNTVDDAVGLADILKDPARCAFPSDQVHLLTGEGATRDGVLAALDSLSASTGSQSAVIVYYSGHGYRVASPTGDFYYLLPYGYDLNRLYQTAVSGAEFTDRLRAIPARKLLVLLDCCQAGGVGEAKAPGLQLTKSPLPPEARSLLAEGSGRVLIASSQEDELSFAGRPYSAFTLALIEALCGTGVARKDGTVRVADLALHAREVVPGRTGGRQHPILHFEQADNFALAYYAGGETQPKGLPFAGEPEIEPEPGAWTLLDQRGQIVHGPQINVAGDVHGPVEQQVGHRLVITGDVSGQVAVGEEITQAQTIGAHRPEVTKTDLAEWRRMLAGLKAGVEAEAPPEKKDAALERVEELEEAITAREPDLATMEYVERWFVRHLPELAGRVTRVIVHPTVGRLVEAAGDALAAEFRHRFGRERG
jgi:hypothetical protein